MPPKTELILSPFSPASPGILDHELPLVAKRRGPRDDQIVHVFFSHRARAHASGQPATRAHALCMWILHDSWIRSCTKIARALANAIELIN